MTNIREWLAGLGLGQHADAFAANDIDEDVVRLLDDGDLVKLGLSLGHRKLLLKAAAALPPRDAGRSAPQAAAAPERRQLTVMFCDLAGSTELSAKLDPEELQKIIGDYRRTCAAAIERFRGYVAKYMGDGVLAYFGYPQALADAADRAVHSGLSVVDAVRKSATDHALDVRVGIATGEVVVGEQIGVDSSREWSVVGDAPNLAARLQAAAMPGQVLVADLTRRLTRQRFGWSAPQLLSLKGFAEPQPAWEAREESAAGGGAQTGEMAELVGRTSELSLLGDRLDLARAGHAQVVLLLGEAGIGKSAVARTLVEQARGEGVGCTLYHCSPFHQSSELNPFAIQIEREAGLSRSAPPADNLDRLRAWLAQYGNDDATSVALFAALLALPPPPDEKLSDLTPHALRAKTLNALEAHLLRADGRGPALLVLEDAHWMDPTSGELLNQLIDRFGRRRIMVLVTARPEFDARWTRRPGVTLLTLNRLGPREAARLVADIPTIRQLPADVVAQLLERAEGNPLFIRELTRAVAETLGAGSDDQRDRQSIERLIRVIPTSLRDLLAERLDRLGPAKETAQAAAVIGQEFDERLLEVIADQPERRKQDLAHLVDSEVIVWRGSAMPTTYAFRHALIQEAAYQSLLKSKRRSHHRRIAESLERGLVPELCDREPERIAQHYAEAGIADRAIDCWHQSGIRAAQRSANIEAVKQLSQALELLRQQPADAARAGKELSLLIALGPTLQATSGWDAIKVREVYDTALRLAHDTGRAAEIFPALWGRWLIAHASGEADVARQLLRQLSDIARELGDPDLLLQLHHAAGSTHCTDAQFAPAIEQASACIAAYDLERHRHQAMSYGGHDPCVCTTCIGALAYFIVGQAGRAQQWSDDALRLAGRIEHTPSIAHAQVYRAELCQIRGEAQAAINLADSVLAIGIAKGLSQYVAWAKMTRGWALTEQGDVDAGIGELEEGLQGLRRTGVRYHSPHRLAMRAQAYAAAGRHPAAIEAIEEALVAANETGECWFDAELNRIKAGFLASGTHVDGTAVESLLVQAVEAADAQRARLWECRARIDLANRLAQSGRITAARDVLLPSLGWDPDVDFPERANAARLIRRLGG